MSAIPPNQTLYVQNLNDKIRKPDLRISLYTLFSTYGIVLDVVALKTMKHRGQAHIVFRDVTSATQAMRALDGMNIFGREMVCFPRSLQGRKLRGIENLVRERKIAQDREAGWDLPDAECGGCGRYCGRGRGSETIRSAAWYCYYSDSGDGGESGG